MRSLRLSFLAALGFAMMSFQAVAVECPLDLSLKSRPETFLDQLKHFPATRSERTVDRPPIFGHCTYQTSSVMHVSMSEEGLCSIGGQPVMMSMVNILDSKSTVVSHAYLVPKSDDSLAAVESALSKIATAASQGDEPKAWKSTSRYWLVDAVYANGDDLWTVTHEVLDEGETRAAHDFYIVTHERRAWLDFASRDLNTCTPFPGDSQPDANDAH